MDNFVIYLFIGQTFIKYPLLKGHGFRLWDAVGDKVIAVFQQAL